MTLSPRAGAPAQPADLVDVPKLVTAYYAEHPDAANPAQRIAFGTSGHRGSAFLGTFNEDHILAVSQAICDFRQSERIDGPLFLGMDTHALSTPAHATALEVFAANGVTTMIAADDGYTPTPAISHAILSHNRDQGNARADGVVITPSHNPPQDGGFKYNPPHGGPAESTVTGWIEARANMLLRTGLANVKRMSLRAARAAETTRAHDYIAAYTSDLGNVLDMDVIRDSSLAVDVDPLGGAGVRYWGAIAERYGVQLKILDTSVDPTFRFMTLDWDGRIRMDPSSPYAMGRLLARRDRAKIAVACDTDHDRHGVVAGLAGLLPPNHYLSVAADYLFRHRTGWRKTAAIGKTMVSSEMIDRVARRLGRAVYDVPVGFKWFVDGLLGNTIGIGIEESAGASFLRKDGRVWTTDKDGIIAALLAAEMVARTGRDPGELYTELTRELGEPVYTRIDAPATAAQKAQLARLSKDQILFTALAGEPIAQILSAAPGNGAPLGGIKVTSRSGWFAARPSGTEEIYKIYAESFLGQDHLTRILAQAQEIVASATA